MHDRLAATTVRQGFFTRSDAFAAGFDDRAIRRQIATGRWHRIRRGAYVGRAIWNQLGAVERHRLMSRAAMLNARCHVALSHVSAAAELGAPLWDLPLAEAHLTRFDGRGGRREAGVVQHHGQVGVEDVTLRDGLLVTSPTRTVLDLATIADVEHTLVVADDLVHRGETDQALLRRGAEAMTRRPDSLSMPLMLGLVDGRSESVGETRTRYHCWAQRLPAPVPQFEVYAGSVLIARLDLAWPELKVWVEFDGKEKYLRLLREGETPQDAVFREKRREDDVRRITGWVCVRVTWADLYHPERLAMRIRQAFAAAAA